MIVIIGRVCNCDDPKCGKPSPYPRTNAGARRYCCSQVFAAIDRRGNHGKAIATKMCKLYITGFRILEKQVTLIFVSIRKEEVFNSDYFTGCQPHDEVLT
nr:hypothetical protein [Microbulbifer aggregans]